MNILYITPSDPALLQTGTQQRSAFLHRALSEVGTVYTVVPEMFARRESDDPVRRVRHLCAERRYSPRWCLKHLLKRLFPLVVLPLYAAEARRRLFPEVAFDCVVVRYVEWAAYYAAWRIAPVYVDIDDDPVEVYETVYSGKALPLKRHLNAVAIRRWRDWVCAKCRGGWVANEEHQTRIRGIPLRHLPNTAMGPGSAYRIRGNQEEALLTVGCMAYEPNWRGVDHFLRTCWPGIKRAFPNMRYRIAGQGCPKRLAKKWQSGEGVEVLGFVEDLDALYEQCLMTVAPVYSGGGTSIKVIQSLLYSRPCLASAFALRGWKRAWLDPANGVIPLDEPEQLASALREQVSRLAEGPDPAPPAFAAFAERHFGAALFREAVAALLAEATPEAR